MGGRERVSIRERLFEHAELELRGFADEAAKREFPVLIAESFPRYIATTNGATSWDGWFAPFFGQLLRHPAVQDWSYIDREGHGRRA